MGQVGKSEQLLYRTDERYYAKTLDYRYDANATMAWMDYVSHDYCTTYGLWTSDSSIPDLA